ncbi:MAG: DUF4129 domain-containing protein, partial [Oscillatoriales cyanobacterium SM2_2_1]|nr:DUF4129 domain-containing protein [Oscillatoriales cyanobacterium SM2_2_1]
VANVWAIAQGIIRAITGLVAWIIVTLSELGWVGVVYGIIGIFGLGLAGWGLWQLGLGWRRYRRLQRLDPVQRVYQQTLGWLAEQGIPKQPWQTPQEFLLTVGDRLPPAKHQLLQDIIQAYQDWYYGGRQRSAAELRQWLRLLKRPFQSS